MADAPAPDVAGTVFDVAEVTLARTYAEALLGAAENQNVAEPTLDELDELIDDVWTRHPDFAVLLGSPALSLADKDRILADAFDANASPLVARLLHVLNARGRLGILPAVVREARALWDRRQNRRHVWVTSAVPLDDDQINALRDRVAPLIRATPVLHFRVDESIVGGLLIQVDDYLYDASVRSRYLERFRRRLIEQKTHEVLAQRDKFSSP